MPIQRRSAPTLEGVARQIKDFERLYDMSTAKFLSMDPFECGVDEDDAIQWFYLNEQNKTLREAAVGCLYSDKVQMIALCNAEEPQLLAA